MTSRNSPAYAAIAAEPRAERIRLGLSQREVATRIGSQASDICTWERLRIVPGFTALAKWVAALGYDVALVPAATGGAEP